MTKTNEQGLNDFKVKIIRQLKNPYSAFNCLLSIQERGKRARNSRSNIAPRDIVMHAEEFKTTLRFTWDETIRFQRNPRDSVMHERGGHRLLFEQEENADEGLNLSDTRKLEGIEFVEECIIPSPDKSGVLIVGIKKFLVTHDNDYEFHKEYSRGFISSIELDLNSMKFSGSIHQLISIWDNLWVTSDVDGDRIYLEYLYDERKYKELKSFFNTSGINFKTADAIISTLRVIRIRSDNWYEHKESTRLGCLVKLIAEHGPNPY